MAISTNLGAGYALVPVPPDDNPDHGGGPIRISPLVVTPAHAGNTVFRTPHAVVREGEPGAVYPGLENMMFLPDGRLRPARPYAFDMFRGTEVIAKSTSGLRGLVPALAMFAGGAAGYKAAREHKMWGMVGGAVVGGILGLIFR